MESTKKVNLPNELVQEILLRSRVKALSRFKLVSKEWCSLIESPDFVERHFNHESNEERLLIKIDNPNEERYRYALFVDETFSEYEEPCQLQIPGGAWDAIGPVNGVFCVVTVGHRGPMALLNPALRQFKPLPLFEWTDPPNMRLRHSELGFGWNPSTVGNFKLVLILYLDRRSRSLRDRHCVVYVCTSDSDSWRLVEDVDPIVSSRYVDMSLGNTYLNGVYYWLLKLQDDADVAILAFDMMTEKFREIKVTGCVAESELGYLAICRDSLALLMCGEKEDCETDGRIDVWIYHTPRVSIYEELWIKSLTVGPSEELEELVPLCFWKNNGIVLQTERAFLTLYDLLIQELRTIPARVQDDDHSTHTVFKYKESLVSIKGETGNCKLWDTSSDFIQEFFQVPSSSESGMVIVNTAF